MRRVQITLDPEYRPWEDEVVNLRKTNKWISLVVSIVLLLGLAGYWVYHSYGSQVDRITARVAGALPVSVGSGGAASSSEQSDGSGRGATSSTSTQRPLTETLQEISGKPGLLALQDGLSVSYLDCERFRVVSAGETLAEGTTDSAPVIDVTGAVSVAVQCDGEEMGR